MDAKEDMRKQVAHMREVARQKATARAGALALLEHQARESKDAEVLNLIAARDKAVSDARAMVDAAQAAIVAKLESRLPEMLR